MVSVPVPRNVCLRSRCTSVFFASVALRVDFAQEMETGNDRACYGYHFSPLRSSLAHASCWSLV